MTNRNPGPSPEGVTLQSYLGVTLSSNRQADQSQESDRRAIWYGLTALEQEIGHWSLEQSLREARVVTDLLKDAWAILDGWRPGPVSPLLMLNFLERIADRASSTNVLQHVENLRVLLEKNSKPQATASGSSTPSSAD